MNNEKRGSQASSQAAQGSVEWQAGRGAQCTRRRPAHSTGDPVPAGGPRTRLGRRGRSEACGFSSDCGPRLGLKGQWEGKTGL